MVLYIDETPTQLDVGQSFYGTGFSVLFLHSYQYVIYMGSPYYGMLSIRDYNTLAVNMQLLVPNYTIPVNFLSGICGSYKQAWKNSTGIDLLLPSLPSDEQVWPFAESCTYEKGGGRKGKKSL